MKKDFRKVLRIVLITLIAANLVFIFTQSLLPPAESSKQSDKVGEIIEEIIPPDTKPGEFVQKNVRKLAHFFEFGALGALTAAYVIFFLSVRRFSFAALLFGFISAFVDESLQYISGRGPAIFDVWIDLSGFALFSLIFYTVCGIVRLVKQKSKQKL